MDSGLSTSLWTVQWTVQWTVLLYSVAVHRGEREDAKMPTSTMPTGEKKKSSNSAVPVDGLRGIDVLRMCGKSRNEYATSGPSVGGLGETQVSGLFSRNLPGRPGERNFRKNRLSGGWIPTSPPKPSPQAPISMSLKSKTLYFLRLRRADEPPPT